MSVKTTIQQCARCGCTHEGLHFAELGNPVKDLTHWATCPSTHEPILLLIQVQEPKES